MKQMNKIPSSNFNFSFFLSDKVKVDNLIDGAERFGGATKFQDGFYSNIESDDYIKINPDNNTISIFIPSTIDVNIPVENTEFTMFAIDYLGARYNTKDIVFYATKGSWYSEELRETVVEDISIVEMNLPQVTEEDINYLVVLANLIKDKMRQEGVSIAINSALAIV